MEPLKTLRAYRSARTKEDQELYGNSPLFGVNLAIDDQLVGSCIKVGEKVFVVRRQKRESRGGGRSLVTNGIFSVMLTASVVALAFVAKKRFFS